jgi:hypothetical protein
MAFDWRFYVNKYPDLRKAGINTEAKALAHWNKHGINEKRICADPSHPAILYISNSPYPPSVGFYSNCSIRLHKILLDFNTHKRMPYKVNSSKQFKLYKINAADVSHSFFKEDTQTIIPYSKPIAYGVWDQLKSYKTINFTNLSPFVTKYFSPSDNIINIKNRLLDKYKIIPEECIAVYYRGTDKKIETLLGSFSTYHDKVKELMNKNCGLKLLVQTDSTQFRDFMKQKFPSAIMFSENVTSAGSKGLHYVRGAHNYNDAQLLLATILIIAKCKVVVCSSGNVSIWALLYRGTALNVHQYLTNKWIT